MSAELIAKSVEVIQESGGPQWLIEVVGELVRCVAPIAIVGGIVGFVLAAGGYGSEDGRMRYK